MNLFNNLIKIIRFKKYEPPILFNLIADFAFRNFGLALFINLEVGLYRRIWKAV